VIFNSLTFIVFFAIVLALHSLPLPWTVRKINLLIASYIFYAAWSPPFVVLLWITTLVDFLVAKLIYRTEQQSKRRLLLLVSLAGNLGVLGYFKYGAFLLKSFVALLASFGIHYSPPAPDIILPIGISFYTFVTLSYTIDVYRKEIRPTKSFLDFCLLVTFFPHLVAGPILRAANFLPQCIKPRRATSQELGWGLTLMIFGLFEKVALADAIVAPVADKLFTAANQLGFQQAWIATLAFAAQIFLDFDGYSICAIGAAMCLGFAFPDNFRFPYAAIGFSDFWRRWHISLSTWLRDYLYVSLGGNRKGRVRTYTNLMLTMLIGGLWHGAAWRFVVWGGLHGIYLTVERMLKGVFPESRFFKNKVYLVIMALVTFLLISFTWVFFRANDFHGAFHMTMAMIGAGSAGQPFPYFNVDNGEVRAVLVVMAGLLLTSWMLRDSSLERVASKIPWWAISIVLTVMMLSIVLVQGDSRAFIYFQF
jgi:D-alanyl-lipoteichoic acid acyltransferase DltB (MBOAT superfamily)